MLEVRKYTKQDKVVWDNFIDHSKNSTFLFKRDFMDYHQDRFKDCSLMVFEDNLPVAVLPAHKIDNNTIASHLGLSYGGLILRKTEKLLKTLQIVHQILFFLKSDQIDKIIYNSFHKFYNSIGSEEIDYANFLIKAKLTMRQIVSVINLNDKLEMNKNRKRNIKKARKKGVIIKEVETFDEYWNDILIPNLKCRYNAKPIHTLAEITGLHQSFPSNIRQFNAYYNGVIVAGSTIFESSNVVRVQYNSANLAGKMAGASDLLYNELIENYFKHKNYLDFGTSFDSNCLNVELLNWKESFGARTFSVDTYEIETKNHVLLKKCLAQMQQNGDLIKSSSK